MIDEFNQSLEQVGDSPYHIVRDDRTKRRVGFYYIDDNNVIELENLDPDNTSKVVKYIEPLDALYIGGFEGGLLTKGGALHKSGGRSFYPVETEGEYYNPPDIQYPESIACFYIGVAGGMNVLIFRKIGDAEYKKAKLSNADATKKELDKMLIRLFSNARST